ncbi:hypothetical protein [Aureimonas sp. ME7]|uniref:hypothetical protein n=1 Tax=Aureimonas sp. ME7 TaxID=2744252 RepID=UPI0015F48DD8|nr:hypothetical protein [Aureimonas sp. ME7]
MTSFVIRTRDEDDLGFLLFAAHEGEWPPAGTIDCVFTGSPHDPSLLDDPRGRFVVTHKDREYSAEIGYTPSEMRVRIDLGDGWLFEIASDEAGNAWTATRGTERLGGSGLFL